MTQRDFNAEMRAIIERETSRGSYISRIVASEIVGKLIHDDPELLHGWLMLDAERALTDVINTRDRSARTRARYQASREQFAVASEAHEKGDSTAIAGWLALRYTALDGTRKMLGDLRRDDLNHLADNYDNQLRRLRFEAAFLRALAGKVKNGTVAEHFTNEQISKLRNSLS